MMAPEETATVTGYKIGGVCPFALPDSLPVLMDESLFTYETVYPAAGDDSSGVPIAPAKLLEITGAVRADVAADPALI